MSARPERPNDTEASLCVVVGTYEGCSGKHTWKAAPFIAPEEGSLASLFGGQLPDETQAPRKI